MNKGGIIMTGPIDAVMAIHNAFRHDMTLIDAAAHDAARGKPGLAATVERFRFFNEVLEWHAHGEELAIFPALEAVAPSVAEAYEKDHRALDDAFVTLSNAVSARDPLDTARATAAFKFYLDIHLDKEDAHLYRIIKERVSVPDQGHAVGVMANTVPEDRFPELVAWMYPLMGIDDRENMTRIWQMVMPAGRVRGSDAARRERNWRRMDRTHRTHPRVGGCALNQQDPASEISMGDNRRPSARAAEPLIRVGDDFEDEYPGASALGHRVLRQRLQSRGLADGLAQPADARRIPTLAERAARSSLWSREPDNHSSQR